MEIAVSDSSFDDEVLAKSKKIPVLVDFWASWCGPCLALKPVLEKLAKGYEGKFVLATANLDENNRIASEYKVMSIPSVKLFKEGKVVGEFMGFQPEIAIKKFLNTHI